MSTTSPTSGPPRTTRRRRRRRPPSVVLLRQVPGTSPVHRLWAGTKLLVTAGVSVTLSFIPTWPAIGMAVALLVLGAIVARIPRGAAPRFPRGIWIVLLVGAVLGCLAGGKPDVHLGGVTVGLGALDAYARLAAVAILLLAYSLMIGWTTPVGDIAPALATLGRPFRVIRIPVDEWATTVALCLRSVPLVVDEVRTLVAARRLRPKPDFGEESSGIAIIDEVVDLLVASLASSSRRAGEMAEAISARGGPGVVRSRHGRLRWTDGAAMVLTAAVCGAMITVDLVA